MDRVLQFIKSTVIWATIWSVLLFGVNQYGQWQAGKLSLGVWTLVTFAFVWLLVFGFVMIAKVLMAARVFGWSLGKQLGKEPIGKAMQQAADDATGGPPKSVQK